MSHDQPLFKLFSGSSHPALAQEIADQLGVELGKIDLKRFACNENYVRIEESVRGKDIFIIQTCTRSLNDDLMELFLMCNAFRLSFAKKIHVILPHFGYARQDRVSEAREPISAKLIADLITTAGADHVITFDLHSDQIQGFFNIPVDNVKAKKLFIDYFRKKNIPDPVVVATDIGGARHAKKFADELGVPLAILHKTRPAHNVSEISHIVGEVKGKSPIIIDDMIDTGGSVCAAKETLIREGSRDEVYLAATHAIFSDPAIERLQKTGFKEIIVTNTLPEKIGQLPELKIISVGPLLANIIEGIVKDKSVSEMFLK